MTETPLPGLDHDYANMGSGATTGREMEGNNDVVVWSQGYSDSQWNAGTPGGQPHFTPMHIAVGFNLGSAAADGDAPPPDAQGHEWYETLYALGNVPAYPADYTTIYEGEWVYCVGGYDEHSSLGPTDNTTYEPPWPALPGAPVLWTQSLEPNAGFAPYPNGDTELACIRQDWNGAVGTQYDGVLTIRFHGTLLEAYVNGVSVIDGPQGGDYWQTIELPVAAALFLPGINTLALKLRANTSGLATGGTGASVPLDGFPTATVTTDSYVAGEDASLYNHRDLHQAAVGTLPNNLLAAARPVDNGTHNPTRQYWRVADTTFVAHGQVGEGGYEGVHAPYYEMLARENDGLPNAAAYHLATEQSPYEGVMPPPTDGFDEGKTWVSHSGFQLGDKEWQVNIGRAYYWEIDQYSGGGIAEASACQITPSDERAPGVSFVLSYGTLGGGSMGNKIRTLFNGIVGAIDTLPDVSGLNGVPDTQVVAEFDLPDNASEYVLSVAPVDPTIARQGGAALSAYSYDADGVALASLANWQGSSLIPLDPYRETTLTNGYHMGRTLVGARSVKLCMGRIGATAERWAEWQVVFTVIERKARILQRAAQWF